MEFAEKTLDSELIFDGRVVKVYKDSIELPTGQKSFREVVKHSGGVVILAYKEDKILLVKQYRYPLKEVIYELPAGKLEPNEDPFEAAKRELEEETGYKSDHLEQLLSIKTTVAFCNELIDIYVATDLKKSHQHLDEGEFVDVAAYDIMELVQMVYDFTIQDAKTVAAIMTYYAKYVLKN